MANRKHLKKSIKAVTSELLADCVMLSLCQQGQQEVIDRIMAEILELHNDYVARISHTEKGQEKLFYKKLREEFAAKVCDLSERLIKA
ncbi:hypothetical protein IMSAGC014_00049 [Bacteroidaceae bacterium]|jgi:hypothetical protein|uniref:hypothetical protein n=1 Tax=Prevotella sp. MGM2 TaxID=2033406 RepID=UPI000CEA2E83|nr:hypothetical protein [Prevotella sp. MGM2]GAY31231.1 hypothetical protein PvtlMGM2_2084 [Prevotella sp. MGM2]GFI33566.1 hypothetical protein IMSAGC014_00049 [Bacteroidaceae bacterium]